GLGPLTLGALGLLGLGLLGVGLARLLLDALALGALGEGPGRVLGGAGALETLGGVLARALGGVDGGGGGVRLRGLLRGVAGRCAGGPGLALGVGEDVLTVVHSVRPFQSVCVKAKDNPAYRVVRWRDETSLFTSVPYPAKIA